MRFVFLNLVCNKKKCLSVVCAAVCCLCLVLSTLSSSGQSQPLSSVDPQRCGSPAVWVPSGVGPQRRGSPAAWICGSSAVWIPEVWIPSGVGPRRCGFPGVDPQRSGSPAVWEACVLLPSLTCTSAERAQVFRA